MLCEGWDDEKLVVEIEESRRYGTWLYGLKPRTGTEQLQLAWPTGRMDVDTEWAPDDDALDRAIVTIGCPAHKCAVTQANSVDRTVVLSPTCLAKTRSHNGTREAELLWSASDADIMGVPGLTNCALAKHRPIEGRTATVIAILPEGSTP
jgi:hypothetical protein